MVFLASRPLTCRLYLDKVASYRRPIFPSTITKVQIVVNLKTESDILGMGRAEEIRDSTKVQEEVIQHQAVWDAGPWLELDMSTAQFKALLLDFEEQGIRMRELARKMSGSFSNATALIDRLVKRGPVDRLAEPQGRRVVLVRVSEEWGGM